MVVVCELRSDCVPAVNKKMKVEELYFFGRNKIHV